MLLPEVLLCCFFFVLFFKKRQHVNGVAPMGAQWDALSKRLFEGSVIFRWFIYLIIYLMRLCRVGHHGFAEAARRSARDGRYKAENISGGIQHLYPTVVLLHLHFYCPVKQARTFPLPWLHSSSASSSFCHFDTL